MSKLLKLALGASVMSLAACGGGGGGNSAPATVAPPPPPPPPPVSEYVAGEFKASSTYEDMCNADDEKFYLRSFTNETYLWYDEVEDRDPTVASESVQDYFDQLKTFETTASGKPKDEFHFYYTTEEYERLISGETFGYGFQFTLLRGAPTATEGREIRVTYVIPGTQAAEAGVLRGAEIITIDDEDVAFGDNTTVLNDGLFPDTDGESHTLEFRNPGATDTITVELTAGTFTNPDILASSVFDNADVKTAYINLDTFGTLTAEKSLFDELTEIAAEDPSKLVLDLRYNGGGFVAVACQLAYAIAGSDDTTNKICTQNLTNDKLPDSDPTPFYTETLGIASSGPGVIAAGQAYPQLDVDEVTVLTTSSSCSASELVVNALAGIDADISLVGGTTCDKPFGFVAEDNCGYTYFTVQFQATNNKGFGDYADGFVPTEGSVSNQTQIKGCEVDDDYTQELGDTAEGMLAAALQYQTDASCPAVPTTAQAKTASRVTLEEISGGIIDTRPGALGQEARILLPRLRDAGLIADGTAR